MDYIGPIDGSPLIPAGFIFFYLATYLVLVAAVYFIFIKIHKRLRISYRKGLLIYSFIGAKIFLLLAVFLLASFILVPTPKVTSINPADSVIQELDKKIEITFNKPVKRKEMEKKIFPDIPRLWVFEDPVYTTHLYRKLVFYPQFPLEPDREYRLSITRVKNFLSIGEGSSYEFSFLTKSYPDILGIQNTENDGVSVLRSNPARGWIRVSVDVPVGITFNKQVDKNSAGERFRISPDISGRISWEGEETLVFTPDNYFPHNTIISVRLLPGVRGLDGTELQEEYLLYFATAEEIFKLDVPFNYQKYALSCEVSALRMVLNYRGVEVSEDELLEDVGNDPVEKNGNTWGNPYVGFVGNVKGKQMVNGYGVFWEPIARAANNYRYAKSFENWSVSNLTDTIQKGHPLIVWVAVKNGRPVTWKTTGGDSIETIADEHSVVAVGFTGTQKNPSHIIVNDPLVGQTFWDTDTFVRKWKVFRNSGVIVY